jgi:hypothetical protein
MAGAPSGCHKIVPYWRAEDNLLRYNLWGAYSFYKEKLRLTMYTIPVFVKFLSRKVVFRVFFQGRSRVYWDSKALFAED